MAESAAACTTGLALNAIPWPAAESMSRSLAPSPIAIGPGEVDAELGGELAQRLLLGRAVDDRARAPGR